MANVAILAPASNALIAALEPVHVAGRAFGKKGIEGPIDVDTVTVSVDGGPSVDASLTLIPAPLGPLPKIRDVRFAADILAPRAAGLHTIFVVAIYGDGTRAGARVDVDVAAGGPSVSQFTPQRSVQVFETNPAPPSPGDWAAEIVHSSRSSIEDLASLLSAAVWSDRGDRFPVCTREWCQVTDPGEDYDRDVVGFSGWLLSPEISKADVPFTHPFGPPNLPRGHGDWECMVALDPEYAGLLASGNAVDDGEAGARARNAAHHLDIQIPDGGLLAVETDFACVPSGLRNFDDNVLVGDRIAAYGRWIVDSGHAVPVSGGDSYRAEVHPPLLMAIGGNRNTFDGPVTRVLFSSRPYLAKQVFTTDVNTAYDDSASDDGTLLEHLNTEMDKVSHSDIWHGGLPDSTSIEAHPKIASKPFRGSNVFRVSVRPPPRDFGILQVSFQFTCRSGVGVQVLDRGDHVDVFIVLNSAGYHAPPLPPRHEEAWDKDRLDAIDEGSAKLISFEQIASVLTLFSAPPPFNVIDLAVAEHALDHGVITDSYDVPDVDLLDRTHAVPFVPVNEIPTGGGVVIDDSQPYPVFGFLEIRLHPADVVLGDPDFGGSFTATFNSPEP